MRGHAEDMDMAGAEFNHEEYSVECASVAGGDHTVVAGRVAALGADPDRLRLLFFRGGYHLTPRTNAWQHSEEPQRYRS